MFKSVNSVGLFGMNAFPVAAEISTEGGVPKLEIGGLADISVQESKMRIDAALKNSGVKIAPMYRVINLAPASVKKSGSLYDLAILVAILAAEGLVNLPIERYSFVGEVSLGGDILPINGALTVTIASAKQGLEGVFLPQANASEASVVEDVAVYGVSTVRQLIELLKGEQPLKAAPRYLPEIEDYAEMLDFSDVKGQETVKTALETAAAGFHNVLLIGTPGTGKSMVAKRLPSILPKMTFAESLETTQIHSIAGVLDPKNPLIVKRVFRAVSHTASAVGLIGGGGVPQPGEISLAHNGVLFLDELPEFDRKTLETLRQPLEDGVIHISRASGKASYPCNIMLVAAMNPCPCGNFGHPTKACTCTAKQISTYLGRISQPVLDRIDIQVEAAPVGYEHISSAERSESSKRIRERVEKARQIQAERYKGSAIRANSGIPPSQLHVICEMEKAAAVLIKNAFERLGISARAYERILKVARTIADLEGKSIIEKRHAANAIMYRSLDKKYWSRG